MAADDWRGGGQLSWHALEAMQWVSSLLGGGRGAVGVVLGRGQRRLASTPACLPPKLGPAQGKWVGQRDARPAQRGCEFMGGDGDSLGLLACWPAVMLELLRAGQMDTSTDADGRTRHNPGVDGNADENARS